MLKEHGQTITVQMPMSLIVNDTDAMADAAEKGIGIGRIITPMIQQQLDIGIVKPVLQKHWPLFWTVCLFCSKQSKSFESESFN